MTKTKKRPTKKKPAKRLRQKEIEAADKRLMKIIKSLPPLNNGEQASLGLCLLDDACQQSGRSLYVAINGDVYINALTKEELIKQAGRMYERNNS